MFAQEVKVQKGIVTQRYESESVKNNQSISHQVILQDVRVNMSASRQPLQMASKFWTQLSKGQQNTLIFKITSQLNEARILSKTQLMEFIREVAPKTSYEENDLNALAKMVEFTIIEEVPRALTQDEIYAQNFDEDSITSFSESVLCYILEHKGLGQFTGTDGVTYYHKTHHAKGGKPIWKIIDGKIHICGIYQHAGKTNNKYHKTADSNGDGPTTITIKG